MELIYLQCPSWPSVIALILQKMLDNVNQFVEMCKRSRVDALMEALTWCTVSMCLSSRYFM